MAANTHHAPGGPPVSLVRDALTLMLIIAAFKFAISRIPPIASLGAYL